MEDSPISEGRVLAGKYRVEKVLGSGGMGVVVAAWHLELERRVAVKFLTPTAMERADTAERFRREARAAAKIRSEHVARVIDVGTMEGGLPYMVMEYLDGNDLSDEMQRVGVLPPVQAVDYVLQILEALAEAHSAGIVHRDLKPANLFLARRPDGSRIVKVLDFGISKSLFGTSLAEMSLTRSAVMIGSPLYMSPEQMRSAKDVDTRTDIWSLGVILYEMITGVPPHTGDSIPALCAALLSQEPVPIRELRPEVLPGLEQVVLRCLAKDPERRFSTVSELARALAPFGSSESQLHVDRATRVQHSAAAAISGASTELLLGHSGVTRPAPRAISNSDLHGAGETSLLAVTPAPAPTSPPVRATVNSWGNTNSRADQGRKRSTTAWLLGFGLAFLMVVGLAVALETRTKITAQPAPNAALVKQTAAAPVSASAVFITPAASSIPPFTSGSPPLAWSSAPTGIAPTSPPSARPPAKPTLAEVRPTTVAHPPPTPTKDAEANDLSEFGGRR